MINAYCVVGGYVGSPSGSTTLSRKHFAKSGLLLSLGVWVVVICAVWLVVAFLWLKRHCDGLMSPSRAQLAICLCFARKPLLGVNWQVTSIVVKLKDGFVVESACHKYLDIKYQLKARPFFHLCINPFLFLWSMCDQFTGKSYWVADPDVYWYRLPCELFHWTAHMRYRW